jgi:hypothetical protein
MAMVNLMDSGARFKHDDPLFENILWDCEMMRMELEKKKHDLTDEFNRIHTSMHDEQNLYDHEQSRLAGMISTYLFDTFTYNGITQKEEVMWLEYFHEMYDLIMDDESHKGVQFYKSLKTSVVMYDSMTHPDVDPPTQEVRYLSNLFDTYMKHQRVLLAKTDLGSVSQARISKRTLLGERLIAIRKELRPINGKFEVYQRIVSWSMH